MGRLGAIGATIVPIQLFPFGVSLWNHENQLFNTLKETGGREVT